jgi:hypothetical protein
MQGANIYGGQIGREMRPKDPKVYLGVMMKSRA